MFWLQFYLKEGSRKFCFRLYQLELGNSPPWPKLLLPLGVDVWPWAWEGRAKPSFENIDPIEPLGMLSVDGIRMEKESFEIKSGRSSDDDEDGAKVATEKPTG